MERRARWLRSSADDAECHPGGGRGFQVPRAPLAGSGAPRHLARDVQGKHAGQPQARHRGSWTTSNSRPDSPKRIRVSRSACRDRGTHREGRTSCSPPMRQPWMPSRKPWGLIDTSSRRSGTWRPGRRCARARARERSIRSTATLACVGRQHSCFEDEFIATLEMCGAARSRPDKLKG